MPEVPRMQEGPAQRPVQPDLIGARDALELRGDVACGVDEELIRLRRQAVVDGGLDDLELALRVEHGLETLAVPVQLVWLDVDEVRPGPRSQRRRP